MPQARAEYCRLPSTHTCYILGEGSQEGASGDLNLRFRSMAEISMLVTSIDPLAAYKVSDDLIVELVDVTATVEDDLEESFSGHVVDSDYRTSQIGQTPTTRRVYARQPPSPNDLCQKRGSHPWRPNKIQDRCITRMGSFLKRSSSVICC
jgi:hypothetical protein